MCRSRTVIASGQASIDSGNAHIAGPRHGVGVVKGPQVVLSSVPGEVSLDDHVAANDHPDVRAISFPVSNSFKGTAN